MHFLARFSVFFEISKKLSFDIWQNDNNSLRFEGKEEIIEKVMKEFQTFKFKYNSVLLLMFVNVTFTVAGVGPEIT